MLGHGGSSSLSASRWRHAVAALVVGVGTLLPAVPVVRAAPDGTSTTVADETTTTTTASSTTTTSTSTTTTTSTTVPATTAPTDPVATPPETPPAVTPNAAPAPVQAAATCSISSVVRQGVQGAEALCAEQTLGALGLVFIGPDDTFGVSTANALKQWQRANGLAADGIVGQVTGTRLGIWVPSSAPAPPPPTPPAPPTTAARPVDGLPANSGSGRRIVYSRAQQRVWAVEADGEVVKTHRVSGRLREPYAGTYQVYSRSMYTYATGNPAVKWRYMVRFAYGPNGGRIGFHEIPNKNGVPLQSAAQLGQPLSNGCVRQATPDAQWMWDWAGVGTTVVVL